jgi:hypothetical protein
MNGCKNIEVTFAEKKCRSNFRRKKMSKQFSPKKNVEVICRRKKNVEAIVAEKKVSKQLSPKKNVESNFGRKKNADHIKCRKFQDVVIKRY